MATKKPADPALTKVRPLPHEQENRVPKQPKIEDVIEKTTKGVPAVVNKPGTAVVDFKAKMAALVVQTKKAETPQTGYISLKNSRMSIGDTRLPGDKIRAIVVDYRLDNEFYASAYNNKPQSPDCHAVRRVNEWMSPWREAREGEDLSELTIDEATGYVTECADPQVPAGMGCDGCKMLEFKSARFIEGKTGSGKGKACRESRRLFIAAADQCTTPADVERAPIMTLIPPPTSLSNFRTFANECTEVLGMPTFGVVVEIELKPHDQYLIMLHYKIIETVKDESVLNALLGRYEQLNAKDVVIPKFDDSDEVKDARGGKF